MRILVQAKSSLRIVLSLLLGALLQLPASSDAVDLTPPTTPAQKRARLTPKELLALGNELQSQLDACNAKLAQAQATILDLQSTISATEAQLQDCLSKLPPPPSGLPDTGQSTCYDEVGNVIDCASTTCPGQDGRYATGCPAEGRFTDNGDGTVTDHCTGLMWQKDTGDVNGDGQSTDQDFVPWCEALAYCENLSFAGHDDWRLPNVRELQSIVDYGRANPAIDPVLSTLLPTYWASSLVIADGPGTAWGVEFFAGTIRAYGQKESGYVRAVRNGNAP